jgi:disulfide bond formation protein DsbB
MKTAALLLIAGAIQGQQSLPSPLIIIALIVALVALFGTILSLYLRWRDKKTKKKKRLFLALPQGTQFIHRFVQNCFVLNGFDRGDG